MSISTRKTLAILSLQRLRSAVDILLFFPLLYIVFKHLYVWLRLARSAQDGTVGVLRFVVVAFILTIMPGLGLSRALNIKSESKSITLLLSVVLSLSISVLLFWTFYFVGVYSYVTCAVGLCLLTSLGFYGIITIIPIARQWRLIGLWDFWHKVSVVDKTCVIIALFFVQGVFETNVGIPMVAWDALVSWDKWAVDMATRHGIGQYIMGGYPQFIPTLHSVFYKLAMSGGDVIPNEHLLLHGFYVVYGAVLVLALWSLGHLLRVNGIVILGFFILHRDVQNYLSNGYVDIPLAAFVAAAAALIIAFQRMELRIGTNWPKKAIVFAFVLFPVIFIKGNGLIWALLFTGLLIFAKQQYSKRIAVTANLLCLLPSVAYFAHQRYYSVHNELSERSSSLHAFIVQFAHTSLFTPDWSHLKWVGREFASAYAFSTTGAFVALAAFVLLLAVSFRSRDLRIFAISGSAVAAVWFYTASYDFRNALACIMVLAIAVIGASWKYKTTRIATVILLLYMVVFMPSGAYARKALMRPLRPYKPAQPWLLKPDQRHMALRPWGDIRNLMFEIPWASGAEHIWVSTGLYRLLFPRGVYALNFNSFRDVRQGDLFIDENIVKTPDGFKPLTNLRRTGRAQAVLMYKPHFVPVDIRISPAGLKIAAEASGYSLPSNSIHTVTISAKTQNQEPTSGVFEITLDREAEDIVLELAPNDLKRDPYSAYFRCVHDGVAVRLPYWMKEAGEAYPQFILRTGEKSVNVVKASALWF